MCTFIINKQENYHEFITGKKPVRNLKAKCNNIIIDET